MRSKSPNYQHFQLGHAAGVSAPGRGQRPAQAPIIVQRQQAEQRERPVVCPLCRNSPLQRAATQLTP